MPSIPAALHVCPDCGRLAVSILWKQDHDSCILACEKQHSWKIDGVSIAQHALPAEPAADIFDEPEGAPQ